MYPWKSLAGHLFSTVFGWYLLLAVGVTMVQLGLEYALMSKTVARDLEAMGRSFGPTTSQALWNMDQPLLNSIAKGITQSAFVTGVKVENFKGIDVASEGEIPVPGRSALAEVLPSYHVQEVPLEFITPQGDRQALGKLLLYSSQDVIAGRIKYSFFVILINSFIKTLGLWIIFHLVLTHRMSRPLTQIAQAVSDLSFRAEATPTTPIVYPNRDELGFLVDKLNDMQQRLYASHLELVCANKNLEMTVEERTRELKESLAQRLAEIAHMNRNATVSICSASIAHELNQPLAAILSNAEAAELFLEMAPPAIKEVQEILADIQRDDKRASDLIVRLRGLLKKTTSEVHTIDFNEVVRDVMKFLVGEAKMKHVAMNIALLDRSLLISADRVQLQQVMINLVLNSMDAMSDIADGARTVSVRTALAGSSHIEVVVSDTGPGFDDNIGHVFESFFTTKPQGMGLGLSISAAIIREHGGQIWAENGPGGGALIRFTLPLQAAQA